MITFHFCTLGTNEGEVKAHQAFHARVGRTSEMYHIKTSYWLSALDGCICWGLGRHLSLLTMIKTARDMASMVGFAAITGTRATLHIHPPCPPRLTYLPLALILHYSPDGLHARFSFCPPLGRTKANLIRTRLGSRRDDNVRMAIAAKTRTIHGVLAATPYIATLKPEQW